MAETSEYGDGLKEVSDVVDRRFSLSDEMLGVCEFLCDRTFCTMGEAVQAVLPGGANPGALYHAKRDPVVRLYRLHDPSAPVSRLGEAARKALSLLSEGGEMDEDELRKKTGVSPATLRALASKGVLSSRQKEVFRNPYAGRGRITDDGELSDGPRGASDRLSADSRQRGSPVPLCFSALPGAGRRGS